LLKYKYKRPGSGKDLKDQLSKLQFRAGINVTGELDDATKKLMLTPRCGVLEEVNQTLVSEKRRRKRYYLQGTTWKKKDLTYRFLSSTPDLPVDVQRIVLRKMIGKWEKASTLTIREADPSVKDNDVDILILFARRYHGDPYPFDGPGGTLAHAYYPHTNRGLSGDAHFDDDERFTTGTSDGINLDWVAVHEFGHSMGLEHSNVRESIMYPWYKGYFPNIELTYDDIAGIQALYGKPTPTPTPVKTSTGTATPTGTTRATTQTTTGKPTTRIPVLEICKVTKFDSFVMGNDGKTYVFSGDYFWVLGVRLGVESGPRKITSKWKELKTPINSAYTNRDGRTVFFKGSEYWKYSGSRLEEGPRDISKYGLPSSLQNPDAAFVWQGNKKTYFFKGGNYWRYNEITHAVDDRYPRSISVWGVSHSIDSAISWSGNKRTYFFKDGNYWKLDDGTLTLVSGYPRSITKIWMKCPTRK